MHLTERADLPVSELAYGEKRRLEIGLALATAPRLLLLDEPLAGMSSRERLETLELLRSIARSRTMIIIDHDMDAIFELAEKITVLREGSVLVEGTPDEIRANAASRPILAACTRHEPARSQGSKQLLRRLRTSCLTSISASRKTRWWRCSAAMARGKSTTLKSLMGVVRPRSGEVILDGQNLAGQPPHRIAQAGIQLVPEDRRIFGSLNVEENIILAGLTASNRWPVDRVYAMFPRLKERRGSRGVDLSGGEQQMLAIARALYGIPKIVLLDEPFEGLAPVTCTT